MFSHPNTQRYASMAAKILSLLLFVSLLLFTGVSIASSSQATAQPPMEQVMVVKQVPEVQYTGIPTFAIAAVDPGKTVTIRTSNFPANQQFTVRMGAMFTQAIGGVVVDSFNSGAGGSFEMTFDIPAEFANANRVAIRTHTNHAANPFFSYNWFYNVVVTQPDPPPPPPTPEPPTPAPIYTGIPTFTVCSVMRDSQITIVTNNMPPNQTFVATMGAFGTAGIGGTQVTTVDSGNGGALNITLSIPQHLRGYGKIAVRLQTTHAVGPYYAYNWFYNNTASVC